MQTISVLYKLYNKEEFCPVTVSYCIETLNGLRMIFCFIDYELDAHSPKWLRLRKFDVSMLHLNGLYTILYNERNHASNIDTSLFIDKTCQDIMYREHMALG